ncbi:hypothetical protein D3C72_2065200 [compost metagenome]
MLGSHGRCKLFGLVQAALFGQGLAAANLAREPPPAQRAPHHGADTLVQAQRHQLPLHVTANQRVVGLVGHVARQAVPVGGSQRFHQLPA